MRKSLGSPVVIASSYCKDCVVGHKVVSGFLVFLLLHVSVPERIVYAKFAFATIDLGKRLAA